jgi:hypothetical protein
VLDETRSCNKSGAADRAHARASRWSPPVPAAPGTVAQGGRAWFAGWMVTVTPVAFILWVVVIVPGFHAVGADTAAELTAVQMATIRTRWIVAWPIYAVAVLLGAAWRASLNAAPARNHRSRGWPRRLSLPSRSPRSALWAIWSWSCRWSLHRSPARTRRCLRRRVGVELSSYLVRGDRCETDLSPAGDQ